MRVLFLVRTAAVGIVSLLVIGFSGCKARTPAQSDVKADEAAGAISDAAVKAEAAAVAKACEQARGSSYQGVGGHGAVIEFSNTPVAAKTGESGQKPWNEKARFDGKMWLLSATVHGRANAPECLKSTKIMTTRLLVAALGCSQDNTCDRQKAVCSGADCPASLAQVDFKRDPLGLATGVGGPTEAIALTGEGAGPTTRCKGGVLKTAAGTAIGEPLDDAAQCEALRATEHNDLVCACGGRSFLPARAEDGVLVGDPPRRPRPAGRLRSLGRHGFPRGRLFLVRLGPGSLRRDEPLGADRRTESVWRRLALHR